MPGDTEVDYSYLSAVGHTSDAFIMAILILLALIDLQSGRQSSLCIKTILVKL